MDRDNIIEVKNVRKKFKIYYDKGRSLKEKVLFQNRNRFETRWVLNGINFSVKKGEAIGLIGQNGCGKSTTLKLLTRIMYPDEGTIDIKGRVSSLLELGAGFHPDMSGRENIYTNASIFGLTRKEIDARMKDIIEFSELEEFLDNPVRTYSSGMYMRLAFSVAINVDADVLLIDEILAVGDVNFQAKCFNKLREIKANGTTIVIVSHSLGQIEQICDRSIWIQDGLINADGTPRTVHPEYMKFMGIKHKNDVIKRDEKNQEEINSEKNNQNKENINDDNINSAENSKRFGNGKARIIEITSLDSEGKNRAIFSTGETVAFHIKYKAKETIENSLVGIAFIRNDGVYAYGTNTLIDRVTPYNLSGEGIIKIKFTNLNLLPGIYKLDIALEEGVCNPADFYREAYQIEIYSQIDDLGIFRLEHTWL